MPPDLVGEKMETKRFYDAVNVILSLQVKIQPYKLFFDSAINACFFRHNILFGKRLFR
jgi:hypothetical protein